MPDHTGRGFWCDFCKDYHQTVECQHPAKEDFVDKEELEGYGQEISGLENQVADLEDEIEHMVEAISSLIKEHPDAKPELISALEALVS